MIKINGLDHINLNVGNLIKSVNFYQNLFGFSIYESGVSSSGNDYKIIGLPGKLFLCLYENENSGKGGAMNHFGINISDFDKSKDLLTQKNIESLYGGVINYNKSRSLYIADPDGNEIELSERFGGGF